MKLKRNELIEFEEEWVKKHPNVTDNPTQYASFLDGLKELIVNHDYESDERFVTYGRREFLRQEFSDYLNERTYCGSGKYNDAFVDITDFYSGNSWISMSSVPQELDFRKIDNADIEYKKSGVVCKQEADIILDMIKEFKEHLSELNRE